MKYLPLVNKKFCLTVVFVCFTLLFYCLGVLFNHPSKRGGDIMANNSSLTDNFVKALSYYLALSGKSKKEVADGIGIPPTTFSSWSNGKHLPDMDRLQNLATYLGALLVSFSILPLTLLLQIRYLQSSQIFFLSYLLRISS